MRLHLKIHHRQAFSVIILIEANLGQASVSSYWLRSLPTTVVKLRNMFQVSRGMPRTCNRWLVSLFKMVSSSNTRTTKVIFVKSKEVSVLHHFSVRLINFEVSERHVWCVREVSWIVWQCLGVSVLVWGISGYLGDTLGCLAFWGCLKGYLRGQSFGVEPGWLHDIILP